MTNISRDEVLHIARISRISLHEDEIEALMQQLQGVLDYAQRVVKAGADSEEPSTKNINVFREDLVVSIDPEPILAQAPEREGFYFVVPVILDN